MIVTCESCGTKFRLDPTRLKGRSGKVRCTRCKHIFTLPKPDDEFAIHVDLSDESPFSEDEQVASTAPFTAPKATAKSKKSGLPRIVLWAVLLIVVLGGAAFVYLNNVSSVSSPEKVNVKGPGKVEEPAITIMDTLQSYFLQNVNLGQIFVVEGEILNETSKPVQFVLLEGKLYTVKNTIDQSQSCFAGNKMSRDELKQLNIGEIQNRMNNREGKDGLNANVQPKQRVPFQLVFHRLPPPDTLTDFTVEVRSAQVINR